MTDFKLPAFSFSFSFNVTKLNTSPELVIKEATPLVKGHSTSHRLYSCLGCGKHVYICRRCDRGHQYCFDGCAISEPKKHASNAKLAKNPLKPSVQLICVISISVQKKVN